MIATDVEEIAKSDDSFINRSATRWIFSPFQSIDLSDRVASGHREIFAGTFTRIKNQSYRYHEGLDVTKAWFDNAVNGDAKGFTTLERPALDIAIELRDVYSETGTIIIDGLTGIEDSNLIVSLQQVIFGEEPLPFANDNRRIDGTPTPVLPIWLDRILEIGAENVKQLKGEAKERAEKLRLALVASIRTSISYCTDLTETAKGDIAAGATKRRFNWRERRAFLALGEKIPNDLPMTANQQQVPTSILNDFSEALSNAFQNKSHQQTESAEMIELREQLAKNNNEMAEIRKMLAQVVTPKDEGEKSKDESGNDSASGDSASKVVRGEGGKFVKKPEGQE